MTQHVCRWRDGNRIALLENGEAFFPAVFNAIAKAQQHIILETFIWFEDNIGWQLRDALLNAAQRGVHVECLLDGYGSPPFSEDFVNPMTAAGIVLRYYDPRPLRFGMRTNIFRRMHRKIVVVDRCIAFIGGINYSAEHMTSFGPQAKQDYAVRLEGPIVDDIFHYSRATLAARDTVRRWWGQNSETLSYQATAPGETQALFVWRDNDSHRDDIERHYLRMLATAKREVIIANAYFFPGYRILHAMRNAARRGVAVRLITQGEPDRPIVKVGARLLYRYLLRAGVSIYEYQQRPLHGKVAVMDDSWATVGSSNLDPLSLSLNLEANVIVHDRAFNQTLHSHLETLIQVDCQQIDETKLPPRRWWNIGSSVLAFHFLRHFPAMVGWLPAHTPRLKQVPLPARPQIEAGDRRETPEM